MANVELKIDGEVIVLTSHQTAQLKRAVENEMSVPAPKQWGNFTLSVKKESKYHPMLVTSSTKYENGKYGYDLGPVDVAGFIKQLKAYAVKVFPDHANTIDHA